MASLSNYTTNKVMEMLAAFNIPVDASDEEIYRGIPEIAVLRAFHPDRVCPECDEHEKMKGDYLCHECRYGIM